jgi:nucleotide-binding universal stress UspA family protein
LWILEREAGSGTVKKILHPTDFSSCAEHAQVKAMELARALGAELVLLHVTVEGPLYREGIVDMREVQSVFESQRQWARQALEERATACRAAGVPTLARVLPGVPHEVIAATAESEAADLIVMGTRGRGGFSRWFLGSVADRVIRTAVCPVMAVRESERGGS